MLRPVLSCLFFVIAIVARCCPEAIAGDVLMDGNGYLGIVVAFEPDIAADNRLRTVLATRDLLKETSKKLNRSIGKYMKGITFLFPKSWDLTRMFPGEVRDPNAFETASSADFHVTAHGTAFGNGPHALQYNGCGGKGYKITVPAQFLLDNEDASRDNAKIMAVEWMKYRYGVFSEGGFPDDPLYPLFYSVPGDAEKNIHATDCADVPVAYRNQSEDGNVCYLELDTNTGRPTTGTHCRMLPDPQANPDVTSSLLSSHNSLSSVQFVCGDANHGHNVRSPNKQNTLCRSRSIMDVLKQHSDFHQMNNDEPDGTNTNLADTPVFHYVQERPPRIVLAIDYSNKMAHLQDILFNAAADLIYSLPSGSEFGYLVFQQIAQVIILAENNNNNDLLSIPRDMDDRNKLVLKMRPSGFNESSDACVKCALLKAIQMLAPSNTPNPGTIILMTASDPTNIGRELLTTMRNAQLCLKAITLPGANPDGFKEILDDTDGCSKAISVSEGATLETMKQLVEILNNVANSGSFVGQRNVMLKLAEVDVENPVTFTVDESYENFTVWVSHTKVDIFRVSGSIDLTSERSFRKQKLATSFNFYVMQIWDAQPSKWTFSLRPSNDFESVLLKVMALEKKKDIIDVNAWFEDTSTNEKDSSVQMPIKLYASVFRDNNPIINANVTALITLPDGRERISLKLMDNGLGDPDITQNDGIYSIYFTKFQQAGEYEISVQIDDNSKSARIIKSDGQNTCCGSKGPKGIESNTEPFCRNIKLSYSSISAAPNDGYPPSTINDLRVSAVRGTFEFTLQWSAPGGEKNDDKASRYILKAFTSHEEALYGKSNGIADILSQNVLPEQYGMTQSMDVTINLKKYNTSYYLILKATNRENKFSVSNIVEIYILPMTDIIIGTTTPSTNDIKTGSLGKTLTTVIIICSVAVLLIIIICAIFCIHVRRREPKNNKKSETDNPTVKITKTENKPLNNRNDGSIVASDWHLESELISPISSVPAAVLMQHHEQVQDAKKNNRDPPLFTLENFQEPTEPKVTIDGVIALASSPKLQKHVPLNTLNASNNIAAENIDNVQQKNYLEFKRQITSV